jgi:phospholipase/carboxylesterase
VELLHTVYEPSGEGPHPTIVALHGWGASAMDLLGLAPYLAGGRFLVLCPQGGIEVPMGPLVGYGWFPLTMGAPPDPSAFAAGVDAAKRFVDAAVHQYPIDPRKLVVLGFSQGGVIAYALALREPARFAGLVALSSWLPEPVAQTLASGPYEQLPALVHHGVRDELIDVGRGRESVERLRSWRVPVAYREFEMGHEITADSLADLSAWLEDKILSPIVLAR